MKRNWIALFSFSGTELKNLLDVFKGEWPEIFTDRTETLSVEFPRGLILPFRHERICRMLEAETKPAIVTLHGYKRILPEYVINNPALEIYNVHPGDVVKYPELVGLHPQKRALELGLKETGVVIHEVTTELDRGEIVQRAQVSISDDETEESLVTKLREAALPLWIELLEEYEFRRN